MKSFAVVAAVAGLASAHAHGAAASTGWGKPVYVTDVVTAYTTYCPSATMITHGAKTYTVTEATTLTITDCPCTVTRPVSSAPTAPVPAPSLPAPASSGLPPPPPPAGSSTYYPPAPKPSASATGSAPASSYTGSAAKVQVAGGLLAALGLVAAAL